jgi:DNA-binding NarL/FixJ family response regulator
VKVLLIESESPVRERLAREISELSDVSIEIQDPDDVGVAGTIAQLRPDVVLIDIDHSCGRGLEIIERFHGQRTEGTPIIVAIASSNSLQYRASCHKAGAAFFFNRLREQDWLLDSLVAIQEQLK